MRTVAQRDSGTVDVVRTDMNMLGLLVAGAWVVAAVSVRAGWRWSRKRRDRRAFVSAECRKRLERIEGRKGDEL